MGDSGDYFRDLQADKAARREKLEPQRIEYARQKLTEAGCVVESGAVCPDGSSLRVTKNGKSWTLWPYTGWWNGPGGNQRGIASLLLEVNRG
jgi:hypothetical protein